MLAALTLAGSVAQAGQIYKWVDPTGEIHYSDTVPTGVNAQPVREGDLSIVPGTSPGESHAERTPDAQPASIGDLRDETAAQAHAARRQKMIKDCELNNGIDCELEVDTELRAETIQQGGHVIHQMRP